MSDSSAELVSQVRQLRQLVALLLAVVVAGGLFLVTRSDGSAGAAADDEWTFEQCIKASLSGSGFDRDDLVDHGCLDP